MGAYLCKEQIDTRPGAMIKGVKANKINIIGFSLNSDSRALILYCQLSGLEYETVEIDMLKGEHQTAEFREAHPSGHLPVVQDGVHAVYGSTFI